MKVREHDNISIPATKPFFADREKMSCSQIGSEETIVMAFMFDMLLMLKWSCDDLYWIKLISDRVTFNFYSCFFCCYIHMFNPSIVLIQWIAFFPCDIYKKEAKEK